jgi:hypothetical protein
MPHIKIAFRLTPEQSGHPAITAETMWAQQISPRRAVIDNIPFYTRQAALHDVVEFREADGQLWYTRTARKSGHSLIRVVFFDQARLQPLRTKLRRLGCPSEAAGFSPLIAVDVPVETDYGPVHSLLEEGSRDKWWDYEEAILRHKAG